MKASSPSEDEQNKIQFSVLEFYSQILNGELHATLLFKYVSSANWTWMDKRGLNKLVLFTIATGLF